MPTIFDCCDCCDAVLTTRELAQEDECRKAYGQMLCFECQDAYQADDAARRTPCGGEA